jgi:hypothetical protein
MKSKLDALKKKAAIKYCHQHSQLLTNPLQQMAIQHYRNGTLLAMAISVST